MYLNTIMRTLIAFMVMFMCLSEVTAATSDRIIRVGCFPLKGFFEISEKGAVSGYGDEFTKEVFKHAGLEYEYVFYPSWVEAIDALEKNKIDVLAPAQRTPERENIFGFDSYPIGTEYGALFTLSTNDRLIFEDFENFKNLKVGSVGSLIFLNSFHNFELKNNFSVDLKFYKDTPALVAALNAGEVDAILANMMIMTDTMKLLGRFGSAPFYYMLSPAAAELHDALDTAVDKVNSLHPELQNELNQEFFSYFYKIPFSKQELDFIAHSDTIKVASNVNYPPFSYIDSQTGEIDGVGKAILEKITAVSGLKFSFEPLPIIGDVRKYMHDEGIDILSGIENSQNSSFHSKQYSNTYLKITKYFVGKKGISYNFDDNLKVSIVSSTEASTAEWNNQYPNYKFVHYHTIADSLNALRNGEVDMLLQDGFSLDNILDNPHNSDLILLPIEGVTSNICYKLMNEGENSALILSIINKSLKHLSDKDKDLILSDYVQENKFVYGFSDFLYKYKVQLILIILFISIFISALIYVYRTQKKVNLAIAENDMKLRNITNNINGGVIVLKSNAGMNITFANEGFLQIIGCSAEQFRANGNGSYFTYVHPDDLGKLQEAIETDATKFSMELRIMRCDGSFVSTIFNCTSGIKADGEKELYCVIMDITEHNRLLEQLRIDNKRTKLILDIVDEVFYEINYLTGDISTSSRFMEKFGWTLPNNIGPTPATEFNTIWHCSNENKDSINQLKLDTRHMLDNKEPVLTQVKLPSNKGECRWYEVMQHPILSDEGAIVNIIGLIRDIDEQMKEREKLIIQAQHDPLTGLYNKETFEELVTETLTNLPNQNHAMIFIDLDHFKSLNDILGHMMGDKAICEAADKLKLIFSNYDILSRFGGDEFCIFVKNIPTETLRGKMNWLVEKLCSDYHGAKGDVKITCSCGVACTERYGFEYNDLIKQADLALYYSKEHGRNRYTFTRDIKKS